MESNQKASEGEMDVKKVNTYTAQDFEEAARKVS